LSQFSSPQDWHLNSGLDTCRANSLPLEPCLQLSVLVIFHIGSVPCLGMALFF
jgi:hypothetical protein